MHIGRVTPESVVSFDNILYIQLVERILALPKTDIKNFSTT